MTAQETIAAGLMALGGGVSILNWIMLIAALRTGRFVSAVPLIGGFCLGAGALLLPVLRPYAWAALLLDCGTVATLVALPRIIRTEWQTCGWNLLEEYVGNRGNMTVRLRLFRRGAFTLRWDIKRQPGELGLVSLGNVGTWERKAEALVLQIGEDRAVFGQLPAGDRKGWRQSVGFGHTDRNPDVSLQEVDLVSNE